MDDCGNRTKVNRHRERQRTLQGELRRNVLCQNDDSRCINHEIRTLALISRRISIRSEKPLESL
jgi:hypothetical protein